jgi:hypothetical protein
VSIFHVSIDATSVTDTGVCRSSAEWDIGQVYWPTPEALATSAPVSALGKRRWEEPHGVGAPTDMPPQKRGRGGEAEGILEATRSAARTSHEPVARIPITTINYEPKEAGRGAERLVTPNMQGFHRRPLQGPCFQQGRREQTVYRELSWVEGSVVEKPMQREPEQEQEQQQKKETEDKYIKFPNDFEPEHEALLAATQADRERGSVRRIKCRRCPDETFETWGAFKRHCNTIETHPLKIHFCDNCGDFFARTDSLNRHREHPPAECLRVTHEKAEEKRSETQRVHRGVDGVLEDRRGGCRDTFLPGHQGEVSRILEEEHVQLTLINVGLYAMLTVFLVICFCSACSRCTVQLYIP